MPAITLRKIVWRGAWAIIGAMAVACLYCAVVDMETTPFGLLVGPFVAPSVVLFLILESTSSARWPKHLGFFLPVFLIVAGHLYQICSLRSQAVLTGVSDGADQMIVYFVECYGIGVSFAFGFLLCVSRRT